MWANSKEMRRICSPKTGSSPETKEVINALLDQFYGDFVSTVATARKKSEQDVRALGLDNGPFAGPGSAEGRPGGRGSAS